MSKIRNLIGGGKAFFCPGCQSVHAVNISSEPRTITSGPRWRFNGNYDAPTFTPSILVNYGGADAGKNDAPPERCHSFVTDGEIQFLGDCTHALTGKTVEIPDWPYAAGSYGGVDEASE